MTSQWVSDERGGWTEYEISADGRSWIPKPTYLAPPSENRQGYNRYYQTDTLSDGPSEPPTRPGGPQGSPYTSGQVSRQNRSRSALRVTLAQETQARQEARDSLLQRWRSAIESKRAETWETLVAELHAKLRPRWTPTCERETGWSLASAQSKLTRGRQHRFDSLFDKAVTQASEHYRNPDIPKPPASVQVDRVTVEVGDHADDFSLDGSYSINVAGCNKPAREGQKIRCDIRKRSKYKSGGR